MKKLLLLFIVCILSFACSPKNKKDPSILSEKQMTDVIWDLARADYYVADFLLKDSSKVKKEESTRLYDEIFSIHHISAEQFKKSLAYYQSDPYFMRPILDSLAQKQRTFKPTTRPIPVDTFQHVPKKPRKKDQS